MAQEYKAIESRYYRGDYPTDESMAEARVTVVAAMDASLGDRRARFGNHYLLGGSIRSESNGMPSTAMTPSESPAWRRRIEKVRREIAEHASEIRVRELAERITFDELQNDLQEIRKWANSLQQKAA